MHDGGQEKEMKEARQLWFLAIGFLLVVGEVFFAGCGSASGDPALKKAIGIVTVGDTFTEIIPARQKLPHTYSDSFANGQDNQKAIEITLAQKDRSGTEKIVVAVIDNLPPKPKARLRLIVTVKIDSQKKLTLKATVPETGYLKEFGPFPVE
jgi:Hsp70 protein